MRRAAPCRASATKAARWGCGRSRRRRPAIRARSVSGARAHAQKRRAQVQNGVLARRAPAAAGSCRQPRAAHAPLRRRATPAWSAAARTARARTASCSAARGGAARQPDRFTHTRTGNRQTDRQLGTCLAPAAQARRLLVVHALREGVHRRGAHGQRARAGTAGRRAERRRRGGKLGCPNGHFSCVLCPSVMGTMTAAAHTSATPADARVRR
jgi:hypothetical protein